MILMAMRFGMEIVLDLKNGKTITSLIGIHMAKIVMGLSGKTNLIHKEGWCLRAFYLKGGVNGDIFMIVLEN